MFADNKSAYGDIEGDIKVSNNEINIKWELIKTKQMFSDKKVGEAIVSPYVADNGLLWNILLYPAGKDEGNKNFVALYLMLQKSPAHHKEIFEANKNFSYQVNFDFAILKANVLQNKKTGNSTFQLIAESNENSNKMMAFSGWTNFMPKISLKEFISENDNLLIVCRIYKKFVNYESVSATLQKTITKECFNCNKFILVLNNDIFSDVEIIVENTSYLAHKVILSTKSPIFMAILDKNKKEKQIIQINDLKTVAVKEMLRYCYIGKIKNIEKNASDILVAASKYGITDLKKLCEEEIIKKIHIDNCIDTIIFAEINNADTLKAASIDFAAENSEPLIQSTDWKKLSAELVTQIFVKAKLGSSK